MMPTTFYLPMPTKALLAFKSLMKPTFKYYGPAILWALFILVLCSWPIGKVAGSPLFFAGFDKFVHCGLFFVLTVFCCTGFIRIKKLHRLPYSPAFIITLIAIGYGLLIEVLQKYIFTWRGFEWNDLFADTIGICMGVFSALIISNATNNENS
jgi:hypothetical protein